MYEYDVHMCIERSRRRQGGHREEDGCMYELCVLSQDGVCIV